MQSHQIEKQLALFESRSETKSGKSFNVSSSNPDNFETLGYLEKKKRGNM
jgi:hypothetical protein